MRYFLFFFLLILASYFPSWAKSVPVGAAAFDQSRVEAMEEEAAAPTSVDPLAQPSMSLRYSMLVKPTISVWFDEAHKKQLAAMNFLVVAFVKDYPLSRYFTAGYTGQVSVLTNTLRKKDYTGLLFDFCFLAKPRFPIDLGGERKTILYSNIELGLNSLMASLIQRYEGAKMQHLPTSGFVVGCTVGVEYLFNTWVALYLESGIRYNFINHLLKNPPLTKSNRRVVEQAEKDDKKFFYHDLVSMPISIGFKLFV